jgi:hypothetical protein
VPAEATGPTDEQDLPKRQQPKLLSLFARVGLGLFLIALDLLLVYLLVVLWQAVQERSGDVEISPFGVSYTPNADVALLMLVVLVAALGSVVHATTSFVDFAGNRQLTSSWVWWYLLRGLVGTTLALPFYFAVRGGFFGASTPAADVNPYGIAALAGLAGLFSKQATDKLEELFDTLFRTRPGYGDDARRDTLFAVSPEDGDGRHDGTKEAGDSSRPVRFEFTGQETSEHDAGELA